MDVEVTVPAEY